MLVNGDSLLEKVIVCIFGYPLINLTYFFKVDFTPQQILRLFINQLLIDLGNVIIFELRLFSGERFWVRTMSFRRRYQKHVRESWVRSERGFNSSYLWLRTNCRLGLGFSKNTTLLKCLLILKGRNMLLKYICMEILKQWIYLYCVWFFCLRLTTVANFSKRKIQIRTFHTNPISYSLHVNILTFHLTIIIRVIINI